MAGAKPTWAQTKSLGAVLVWRELVIRYKRSVLGVVWALIEPLADVLIYVAIFGFILGQRETVESYPLFIVFGVLPWTFLSSSANNGCTALLEHAALVRKVAFHRELLVLAIIFSRLTTLLVGLLLSLAWAGLWTVRGAQLHWEAVKWLPVGVVLLVLGATGLALAMAALQIVLRDTSFLLRYTLRLMFFCTPIIYPLSQVPEGLRDLFRLNPMVGVMACFHTIATHDGVVDAASVGAAAVWSLIIAGGGWWMFRRLQPTVSDLV
jgi:ABC-2 type transport system permease protein